MLSALELFGQRMCEQIEVAEIVRKPESSSPGRNGVSHLSRFFARHGVHSAQAASVHIGVPGRASDTPRYPPLAQQLTSSAGYETVSATS